jgi:hypothetical protein
LWHIFAVFVILGGHFWVSCSAFHALWSGEANLPEGFRVAIFMIVEREGFDTTEFKKSFLNQQVVLYPAHLKLWPAYAKWNAQYFSDNYPDVPCVVKTFGSELQVEHMSMADYLKRVAVFKASGDAGETGPYCHDIPIFILAKTLVQDIGKFPQEVLPQWYGTDWSRYVQFFMSVKDAVTPLHFDTLLTSNLFFQIKGTKRFTIIKPEDSKYCYRRGWRWFDVNPESPDFERYPDFRKVRVEQIDVKAGDMFYMPPGTLHHVRSLDDCISFNIDFHTVSSVLKAFMSIPKGMPNENVFYNYISLRAMLFKSQRDELFEKYKPYLSYVS